MEIYVKMKHIAYEKNVTAKMIKVSYSIIIYLLSIFKAGNSSENETH